MKKQFLFKLLISILFLIMFNITSAQQWKDNLPTQKDGNYTFFDYQKAFNDYWKPYNVNYKGRYIDSKGVEQKAHGYKQFKRWEWYWAPRVDHNTGEFPEKSAFDIWQDYKAANGTKSIGGTWTSIGDFVYDPYNGGASLQECGVGRINCAAFDPDDDDHFWVGAPAGGIWETTDGGSTWTAKNGNELILGVSDIALSPNYSSDQTIYIATGDRDAGDDPSLGVLKSTDDGATWFRTDLKFKANSSAQTVRVIVDPGDANTIYAATSVGFYKSTDAGVNFTFKQDGKFIDMEMIPGSESGPNGADLIATTNSTPAQAWRSTDAGETWTVTFTGSSDETRCDVAVTLKDANYVYIITAYQGAGTGGIYKSTTGGASFSLVYDGSSTGHNLFNSTPFANQSSGGQGFYDVQLAVSSLNRDMVYVGGVNAFISTDGASSFSLANRWDPAAGGTADEVHADHHNAYFRASDNRLFDCNDGGIYYTDNPTGTATGTWTDIADGIVIGQIYDLSVSPTVKGNIVQGYQDNGTKYRDVSTSTTDWDQVREGDGMASAIDPTDITTQWTSYPTGYVFQTTNEWSSYSTIKGTSDAAWYFPIEADPILSNTIYIGSQSVVRYVGGSSTTMGSLGAYLSTMNVYHVGSDLVIWTGSSGDLWKSNTSGGSYTSVYSGLPGNQVMDIAIDDDDYTHVYVSLGGYDYSVVYETTNGGSTWTDISSGLPPVPAGAIVINEQNTTDHEIYVGTDLGVFVKVGSEDWRLFNDNFPVVSITDLEIYYDGTPANSKLYAGTYGRDTWESDLFSIPATPMTYASSTVFQNDPYDLFQGTVKNEIIGIEVEMNGSTSPLDINSFSFNTTGSTNAGTDITNAKLYYTGTSNVFGTTTQFGSTASTPNGNFTVTGTQTLTCGKNYFWLTYDIDAAATAGDYVDAECTSITVGTAKTPTVTAPIGNRRIAVGAYCATTNTETYDAGISNVTFNTIDNTTTALGTDRYNDYTSISTSVDAGSSYNLSTTIVSGTNTFYTSAWIDWNHDYDFDDPGETFSLGSGASNTANVNVAVPVDAIGGDARMRIATTFDSPVSACGTYRYGETEDYTVTVIPNTPPAITNVDVTSGTAYKDGGKDIVITGTDLSGATSVTVAGVTARIISNIATQIEIETAGGAYSGTNEIVVTNGAGSDSEAVTFTYSTRNTIPVNGGTDGHSTFQYGLDGLLAWYGTSNFDATKTIEVYGGTYAEEIVPSSTLTPTSGNRLVIQNHSGETPIINANTNDYGFNIDVQYTTLTGFTVHDATKDNIYIQNEDNIVSLNKSYSAGESGINASFNTEIINNLCYANNDYGVKILISDAANVENNTCYDNGHSVAGSSGVFMTESFNPDAAGWTLGNWTTSTTGNGDSYSIQRLGASALVISPVYNISGYTNVDINYWDRSRANGGTMLAEYSINGGTWTTFSTEGPTRNVWNEHPAGTLNLSGNTIQLRFTGYSGNASKQIYLDDLTLSGTSPALNAGAGLYVEDGTNTTVENNIFVAKSGTDYVTLETANLITVTSNYNTYFKNGNTNLVDYNGSTYADIAAWTGNGAGANELEGDPDFVNAGTDFHLKSTSDSYAGGSWPPATAFGGAWNTDVSDSPALDTGNPVDGFENEPAGGAAINQGCYGNTAQASKSAGLLWNGSTDSDWFITTNWTPETVPTSTDDIIIPDVTPNPFPIIDDGTTTAVCNNLTIASNASVTVATDGQMTVSGTITNNAGASGLVIKSDTNGEGSLVANNTVEATIERFVVGDQWHYMFPTLSTIPTSTYTTEGTYTNNNFYSYNEPNEDYWNSTTTFGTTGWTSEVATPNIPLEKGYLFNRYNMADKTFVQTGGNIDIADKIFDVDYTISTFTLPDNGVSESREYFDGWNLAGNPYTCAVDWDQVTLNGIESGVYYFDGTNYQYYKQGDINGTTPWTSIGIALNDGTQFIPSGQGFMVKVNNTGSTHSTSFTIPASARVHNNQAYYKDDITIPDLLRLQVEKDGYTDELVIRTIPVDIAEVTDEHDAKYDLYKMFAWDNTKPQIFSYNNDFTTNFAINTFAEIDETRIIPLGLYLGKASEYTITNTENNFKNVNIYFHDIELDKLTELSEGTTYSFYSEAGTFKNRFELVFEKSGLGIENFRKTDVFIYPNPSGGIFWLTVGNQAKDYSVVIHNVTGQVVYKNEFINSGTKEIKLNNKSPGVYFIKVIFDNNYTVNKKIIIQ